MPEVTPSVTIGCCGFRAARAAYFAQLPAVEVQHTFYQPPQPATLARWRAEAPPGFTFTVKAWQLITHVATSPTYRRLKRPLTEEERPQAGAFRDTPLVAARVGHDERLRRRPGRAGDPLPVPGELSADAGER